LRGLGIYCVELIVDDVGNEEVTEAGMNNLWYRSRQCNGLAKLVDDIQLKMLEEEWNLNGASHLGDQHLAMSDTFERWHWVRSWGKVEQVAVWSNITTKLADFNEYRDKIYLLESINFKTSSEKPMLG
jgi:hypothetical protein